MVPPGAPQPEMPSRRGGAGRLSRNCDITDMCDEFEEEDRVLADMVNLGDDEVIILVPNA